MMMCRPYYRASWRRRGSRGMSAYIVKVQPTLTKVLRPANRPAFGGTVPLFYQMSRVTLNHGNIPLFVRSRIFFARAQFVTRCRGAPTLMQITQLNVISEIPFDLSQKYQTVPRPNRRATVYFGTQLISVGCILLKKISMWALPTVPLFAGKSRFFTRNFPLKHSPGWQV